jgi:hypothetical protein
MALRYRNHLILEKANLDLKSGFWNVRAHVQFNAFKCLRGFSIAVSKRMIAAAPFLSDRGSHVRRLLSVLAVILLYPTITASRMVLTVW